MSLGKVLAAAPAAMAGVLCAGHVALAGETGSFRSIASFVRDYTEIDHAGGTIIGGTLAGVSTVLESSGAPFVKGGHSLAKCVVYAKRWATGMTAQAPCTLTDGSGGKLYYMSKRSVGSIEEGGGGKGGIELLGGTGRYAGVTGNCTYEVDYLANNRHVAVTDCTWRRSADRK